MQSRNIKYYKKKLLAQKSELLKELDKITDEETISLKDTTGELSSYDNHPADQGTNTYEREKDGALRYNILSLLEKVNAALQDIVSENYGTCQRCGKKISGERLEAMPYTNLCYNCENKEEAYIDQGDRPYNEGITDPPYASSFTDDSNNISYDGEDAWQDVAQYGTSNTIQDTPEAGAEHDTEAYIDAEESVGFVGREDTLYDDQVDNLEEAEAETSTLTGKKTEEER